jgi:hypothetical protein
MTLPTDKSGIPASQTAALSIEMVFCSSHKRLASLSADSDVIKV